MLMLMPCSLAGLQPPRDACSVLYPCLLICASHFAEQSKLAATARKCVCEHCTHLATTHGQCGESILEALLKAQELDYTQGHRGMKPQTTLVWANGRAELRV
eukprot:GHRR01036324.1.p1 GENE.GHRR01036324.1~~GHRR01036324.1.p1  ORF type:complete len:102 (+),score=9.74 GHRR01036324.1:158-463(+)